jgi:hypothetical protein
MATKDDYLRNVVKHGHPQHGNDHLYDGTGNDMVVGDNLLAHVWNNNHDLLFNEAYLQVSTLSASISSMMSNLYNLFDDRTK